jgi:MiaB-like tRNA modifying enzyme
MKARFVTFGCSNNVAESEMMAGLLKKAGFRIVDSKEDLLVVNVCSVKGPSLNKGLKELRKAKTPVVVAGCIPKESVGIIKDIAPNASLIDTHNIKSIVEAAMLTLQGKPMELLGRTSEVKCQIPRMRFNPVVGILPIRSGCTSSCAYCATRLIKGDLVSYPVDSLVRELRSFVENGCREIWVTAQDTGNYGSEISSSLPKLLDKLLRVKGDFYIRLGMANPNFVLKHLDDLSSLLNNPKMFRFVHIPVQSGSDRILKLMGRKYSVDDFLKIVETLRRMVPAITISTDIIVGFPTETKADFKKSVDLIKKVRPDILNISRFWAHPNIAAAKMKQVSTNEMKVRSSSLKKVFDRIALANNKLWLGWKGDVLIDEIGKHGASIGRNFAYKPVVLKKKHKLGELVKTGIKRVTVHDLRGN